MPKVITEIPAEWKVKHTAPGTTPADYWRKFADGQIYALDAADYEGKPEAQSGKATRWAVWAGYKIVQFARHGDTIAVQFEKLSNEDAASQRLAHANALKDAKEKREAKAAAKAAQEAASASEPAAATPAPVDPFAATTAG